MSLSTTHPAVAHAEEGAVPPAYYILGQHGGYFISDRQELARAIELLEATAERYPAVVFNMDLEPYTLDRLAHGERLDIEKRMTDLPEDWLLSMAGRGTGRRIAAVEGGADFAVAMELGEGSLATCYQGIEAAGRHGGELRLSARVRCARGRVGLAVEAMTETGPVADSLRVAWAEADGQWHRLTIDGYHVPREARRVYPHLRLEPAAGGSEGAWMEVECVDESGHALLANGDFARARGFRDGATLGRLQRLAGEGRLTIISTWSQAFLFAIDEESIVRQFTFAQRVIRETLRLPMDAFATQEPCWCGQMPALLAGLGFKGCSYIGNWEMFGAVPSRDGEQLTWRGPDGSSIPVIPFAHHNRKTGKDCWDTWAPCAPPSHERAEAAHARGLHRPVSQNLSWDFLPDRVLDPNTGIDHPDVRFVTIPQYLAEAEPGGEWVDAFHDFRPRLCWGLGGGDLYRDARQAADLANLAERLAALLGCDWTEEIQKLWELALLAQHHDPWVCSSAIFGIWMGSYPNYTWTKPPEPTHWGEWPGAYPNFIEFIRACREEAEGRFTNLLPKGESAGQDFTILNPTQVGRAEWTPIQLPLPADDAADPWAIVDEQGQMMPARLEARDGSQLAGHFLAAAPAFGAARYRIITRTDSPSANAPSGLPTSVAKLADGRYDMDNGKIHVSLAPDGIRLMHGGEEAVSGIFLAARINGHQEQGHVERVLAGVGADGIARGEAHGNIGSIPFTIRLTLRPWSAALELEVQCTLSGERIESGETLEFHGRKWARYDLAHDHLRLMVTPARPARHRVHQPFELREPSRDQYWAVHFQQTCWREGGGGFVTSFDRPSGLIYEGHRFGVVLCHSGHYPLTADTLWPWGFGNSLVHGEKSWRLSLRPFTDEDQAEALGQYQAEAYPLIMMPGECPRIPAAAPFALQGHSMVSGLSREGDDLLVRLWNPLADETLSVSAPGCEIAHCSLDGEKAEVIGRERAVVAMHSMQIRTLRLTRSRL